MALCAVSGNIQTILGTGVSTGAVIFTLVNYGNAVPQVSGTAVVVPTQQVANVNSNGLFGISLQGNDTIAPANTLYSVVFQTPTGSIGPFLYNITGSTFNLNTATPIGNPQAPVFTNAQVFLYGLEIPSGAVNGINKTYILSHIPSSLQLVLVFMGGVLQNPGVSNDYTISGSTITFNTAPSTGPVLVVY